jgi:hypothetical protein
MNRFSHTVLGQFKVTLIKAYREVAGVGLKEAKDAIEAFINQLDQSGTEDRSTLANGFVRGLLSFENHKVVARANLIADAKGLIRTLLRANYQAYQTKAATQAVYAALTEVEVNDLVTDVIDGERDRSDGYDGY